MVLVPALGIAFFVVILVVVPTIVILRDLGRGRPDIAYTARER